MLGSEKGASLVGFRVHGRVQGVGFRWWARQTACAIGLHGHVRNCRDGCVEAVALGTQDQLERFERAMEQGPPGSHVDRLERFQPDEGPRGSVFEITS